MMQRCSVVLLFCVALFLCTECLAEVGEEERDALCDIWKNLRPADWEASGFQPCRTDVAICDRFENTVNCSRDGLHVQYMLVASW